MLNELWDQYVDLGSPPMTAEERYIVRVGFYAGAQAVARTISFHQGNDVVVRDMLERLRRDMRPFAEATRAEGVEAGYEMNSIEH